MATDKKTGAKFFIIRSQSDGRKTYRIYYDEHSGKSKFCTCGDFIFRRRKLGQKCKHLKEFPGV